MPDIMGAKDIAFIWRIYQKAFRSLDLRLHIMD